MEPENNSPLRQIRTFQGDVAEALGKQKTSIVSLERAEKAKEQAAQVFVAPYEEPTGHKKVILLVIGTIVLLALAIGGTWYAYSQYKIKTALPAVVIAPNQFITVQSSFDVDTSSLTRDTLISTIRTEIEKATPAGTVGEIQLRSGEGADAELISTEDFLNLLESSAPASLVRSLDPLFMLGYIGGVTGGPGHTFILIKLDSFENAFPGMLAWEPTMSNDILPLFATDAEIQNVATTSAFTDITVQNKDARVLEDDNGHTVLLYSFLDNNYLIITDNEDSLNTLIDLLDSQEVSR